MLNSYYLQKLIQEIKNLESLKQYSVLSGEWKNAAFVLLSQKMQEKLDKVLTQDQRNAMGITTHERTLTDTFRGKKNYDKYLHPHAHNTLNKLSIFADYQDWDHYKLEVDKRSQEASDKPIEEILEMVIRRAITTEFELYQKLPTLTLDSLPPLFIKEETAFKNVIYDASLAKEKNWTLAYPTYNPSVVELIEHTITLVTNTIAQVSTKEKWVLAWWHLQEERFIHRYDKTIQPTYLLEKVNNTWKIKTRSNNDPQTSFKVPVQDAIPSIIQPSIESSIEKKLEELIRQAMAVELQGYLNLPSIPPEFLNSLFIKNSPAYKEITHNLLLAKERSWTINNESNPSANELMECSIIQVNGTKAQVTTKEYWLLWWWSPLEKKHYIHKEVSQHTYLLEKIDEQWFIKTNASGANSLRVPLE